MYLATLTAAAETLGYYYRVLICQHAPFATIGEVIASFVLLLVPPIILAVINYEVIGKVMKGANVRVGCMSHTNITRTFLLLDVLCFLVQCGAVPLLLDKENPGKRDDGSKIVISGLVLQFIVFAAFVYVSLSVIRKPQLNTASTPKVIKKVVQVCLTTIFILLVRNGYRVFEYANTYYQNHAHPEVTPTNYEWEMYIFEFVPVWAVHAAFAFYNFGWMLPSDVEMAAMLQPNCAATSASVDKASGDVAVAVLPINGDSTPSLPVGVDKQDDAGAGAQLSTSSLNPAMDSASITVTDAAQPLQRPSSAIADDPTAASSQ